MADSNPCSLDNMLKDILAAANVEQSMAYAPSVYQSHFRTATSFLISKLVEIYPDSSWAQDMLDPFIEKQFIPITKGYIQLPDNYRNILGSPMINAKSDDSEECGCDDDKPTVDTANEFETLIQQGKCKKNPIVIVPESEFAYRTKSTYDSPTIENPIGYFSGKKQITICPIVGKVEVMYVRNEKPVVYGYVIQPDDTYLFDTKTSTESEWTASAYVPLYKCLTALYAAYSKDKEAMDWSQILNQTNIL